MTATEPLPWHILIKAIRYSADALNALRKHRDIAAAIMAKLERSAETRVGDVTSLVGSSGAKWLCIGEFRATFEESAINIHVTRIAPRGSVYDRGIDEGDGDQERPWGGRELVLLPKSAFEALERALDAAAHAKTMAEVAAGRQEFPTAEETRAALAAPTPLAFWRRKRGKTQSEVAAAVGISQSYMAGLEAGRRKGDPRLFLHLAPALNVRMEDLVQA